MVTTLRSVANREECCLACFLTTFTDVKSQFFSSAGCRCLLRRSAAGSATDADGGMTGVAFSLWRCLRLRASRLARSAGLSALSDILPNSNL